jgi:cytochrome P450
MSVATTLATPPDLSPGVLEDPYPFYAALRAAPGPVWSAQMGGWLISRYDDVQAGLRDRALSADRLERLLTTSLARGSPGFEAARRFSGRSLFFLDAPAHTHARAALSSGLGRALRGGSEASIARRVDEIVRAFAARGGGDLKADLAVPISLAVMGELAGCPHHDRAALRGAVDAMTGLYGGGAAGASAQVAGAVMALEGYVDKVAQSASRPCMARSALEHAARALPDPALLTGLATDLLSAGYVPLTNLIANTFACLLREPDTLARVVSDPELSGRAVRESLRYEAPNQLTSRIVTRPTRLAGVTLGQGELVFLLLAAAGRDPAVIASPDSFDLDRERLAPAAFGFGAHACPGAALATDVATRAVAGVLRAAPGLRLAGPIRWAAESLRVRTVVTLDVAC